MEFIKGQPAAQTSGYHLLSAYKYPIKEDLPAKVTVQKVNCYLVIILFFVMSQRSGLPD